MPTFLFQSIPESPFRYILILFMTVLLFQIDICYSLKSSFHFISCTPSFPKSYWFSYTLVYFVVQGRSFLPRGPKTVFGKMRWKLSNLGLPSV